MTINLIHDGDHGGDDFITTLMILGNPDLFNLLAITNNFGNVTLDLAAENALRCLKLAGQKDVPVYKGAAQPFRSPLKGGDDAHGENGIGGVNLPKAAQRPEEQHAVDFLIETLEKSDAPLTLCPTGPLTNMALMLEKAPHVKEKIERMIIMGGGGDRVAGNITPFAEFNFYMDPEAADFVLKSGVNIVLHGLSTTHQLIYTPDRHPRVTGIKRYGAELSQIMRAAEHLDIENFGENGAYMHDEQTIAYLKNPDWYETQRVHLSVNTDQDSEEHGNLIIGEADENASTQLVVNVKDPDAVFDFVVESLENVFHD